jgi:putative transposase
MVHYRRVKISGGMYFFTVTLKDRRSSFLIDYIDHLKSAMHEVKSSWPYKIKALVVLPDHLHTIWELPENDHNYECRWRLIKRFFTKKLIKEGIKLDKNLRGEYNLWQSRFWEHLIRNDQDYKAHIDYIHFNPMKHGLVKRVIDWPHSTFHEYVRQGILSSEWGGEKPYSIIVKE